MARPPTIADIQDKLSILFIEKAHAENLRNECMDVMETHWDDIEYDCAFLGTIILSRKIDEFNEHIGALKLALAIFDTENVIGS